MREIVEAPTMAQTMPDGERKARGSAEPPDDASEVNTGFGRETWSTGKTIRCLIPTWKCC